MVEIFIVVEVGERPPVAPFPVVMVSWWWCSAAPPPLTILPVSNRREHGGSDIKSILPFHVMNDPGWAVSLLFRYIDGLTLCTVYNSSSTIATFVRPVVVVLDFFPASEHETSLNNTDLRLQTKPCLVFYFPLHFTVNLCWRAAQFSALITTILL